MFQVPRTSPYQLRRGRSNQMKRPIETRASTETLATPTASKRAANANTSSPRFASRQYAVGIDFGTTFSSAAVAYHRDGEIQTFGIMNYHEDEIPGGVGQQIPTESWYPSPHAAAAKSSHVSPEPSSSTYPTAKASVAIDESMFLDDSPEITSFSDRVSPGYLHGFQVHDMLATADRRNKGYDSTRRVVRPKLMLDTETISDDPVVQELREKLADTIKSLKEEGYIQKAEDIIRDWLVPFCLHIKSEMARNHGYTEDCPVTFVFCVPVCWKPAKNAIMSKAITEALRMAKFGVANEGDVPDLFMVNEAEASALDVVHSGQVRLRAHEVFVLLDNGGGTVDGGCYKVSYRHPFRLAEEVGNPTGRHIGASNVNDGVFHNADSDLSGETYLFDGDYNASIRPLIEKYIMRPFERSKKKRIDFKNKKAKYEFDFPNLREHPTNPRVRKGFYVLSHAEMRDCFAGSLRAVEDVMREQIIDARNRGVNVDVVVIVGGFSDSPALRAYLKSSLKDLENGFRKSDPDYISHIQLLFAPQNRSVIATARGAALRAMDMSKGGERTLRVSVGLTRDIPFQGKRILKEYPHLAPIVKQEKRAAWDLARGAHYVHDTIQWILKKGNDPISKYYESDLMPTEYEFDPDDEIWLKEETIYISDICTEDFWQVTHPRNEGKVTCLGTLKVDLTHLKERGCIPLVTPKPRQGRPHYAVKILLQCTIVNRDIRFSVRWPPNEDVKPCVIGGFSLVAAFPPGTE